jgi:hypothetical protein
LLRISVPFFVTHCLRAQSRITGAWMSEKRASNWAVFIRSTRSFVDQSLPHSLEVAQCPFTLALTTIGGACPLNGNRFVWSWERSSLGLLRRDESAHGLLGRHKSIHQPDRFEPDRSAVYSLDTGTMPAPDARWANWPFKPRGRD